MTQLTGRLVNSHTPNINMDTDNIFSDYDNSQTTKPIAAYFILTSRTYNDGQQSLEVGLSTIQYHHTFTEDRLLKHSQPTLFVKASLQSIYQHAQIYSQHEIPQ